jgi:hypothetical protein
MHVDCQMATKFFNRHVNHQITIYPFVNDQIQLWSPFDCIKGLNLEFENFLLDVHDLDCEWNPM